MTNNRMRFEEIKQKFAQRADPRVIIAADSPKALDVLHSLHPNDCNVKVGKNMFTRYGPQLVGNIQDLGFKVFLDLKYHDIPNTVADAVEAAADLGVWMVNMHTLGGRKMMEAAVERLDKRNHNHRPILIGVTVLTSLDTADLNEIAIAHTPQSLTWALANAGYKSGLDGVVCSPLELTTLKYSANMDNNFKFVVPGVRPQGADNDDQKRVSTPVEAIENGASWLVIGRPVLNAADPVAALAQINQSITDYEILNQQGMGI